MSSFCSLVYRLNRLFFWFLIDESLLCCHKNDEMKSKFIFFKFGAFFVRSEVAFFIHQNVGLRLVVLTDF